MFSPGYCRLQAQPTLSGSGKKRSDGLPSAMLIDPLVLTRPSITRVASITELLQPTQGHLLIHSLRPFRWERTRASQSLRCDRSDDPRVAM